MNRNKIKKHGFTILEMLIALAIIGVISTLSINVVRKANNDYQKMYYTAYNTLLQAVGNSFLNWKPNCSCSTSTMLTNIDSQKHVCWSKSCWEEFEPQAEGHNGVSRNYPGFLMGSYTNGEFNGYRTDEHFCKMLTAQLNTINQNVECQSFINTYATKKDGKNLDYTKGINFFDAFCNTSMLSKNDYDNQVARIINSQNADGSANSVTNGECVEELQPSFVTANGQKFYISRILSTNANIAAFDLQKDREMFRFIAVDLNGDNSPNTQLRRGGNTKNINTGVLPDIVLFAIKSDGTVVPLGRPEFSKNYLNAVVYYPEYLNSTDINGRLQKNEKTNSEAETLFQAKMYAWGPSDSEGADISTLAYNQAFNVSEPFTYSTLLYNRAWANPNGISSAGDYTDLFLSRLIKQFTFDSEGSSSSILPLTSSGIADKEHGCSYKNSRCRIEVLPR